MQIRSATFVKGVVGTDDIFDDGTPQIAFIGRSNAGKSSVINSLAQQKGLARTSSFPGRTQQINIFFINKAFYLVDLPGYGYAKASREIRDQIFKMIKWYLFGSEYPHKIVALIIDANIGLTKSDLEMLEALDIHKKNVVIVANKIDKIKKSAYDAQMKKIQDAAGDHLIIPYSAEKKIGVELLAAEILR